MQSFKSYISEDILTEAKGPTGAQWESIITHQLNKLIGTEASDSEAVETSNKFKDYHEIGKKIAENFKSQFGNNLMTQYGSSGGKKNLSSEWVTWGGTNGTPKTDMYTSAYNISLKKKGGSQLASGGTGESLATFQAALEYLGQDKKSKNDIGKIMDEIEKNFTKVMLKQSKTEIAKIAKDQEKIDSLDPKDQKEIQKFISTEAFHKELNEKLKDVLKLEENKEFMEYYVFEAMSGLKKFKNKLSVASVCVTFDSEQGGIEMINVTPDGSSGGLNVNNPSYILAPNFLIFSNSALTFFITFPTNPFNHFNAFPPISLILFQTLPRTAISSNITKSSFNVLCTLFAISSFCNTSPIILSRVQSINGIESVSFGL